MNMTGAQAILQSLISEGVDLIFGYPGGAIMPTYDALYDVYPKLQHILVRHEQGAVHAAEGYSRATGKVGVCLATSGPGATNLITGITDAMLDSVPVVCIVGQVASYLLGSDAFQEADVVGIALPVTKWAYQVTCAEEIPGAIAKAFYIAKSGRPGPVLLDITKDAQVGALDFVYEKFSGRKAHPTHHPLEKSEIEKAAKLINEAKRPYILAGHGILIAQAENELQQLAETANIPVACTLLGLSCFPSNHDMYVGLLGMHGNYGPNVLTNEADVIIAIGMRFDDRVTGNLATYAKQAKIIHIDIDPAEISKNVPAEVGLVGDAKYVLQQLLPLIKADTAEYHRDEWHKRFQECHDIEFEKIIHSEIHTRMGEIKMAEVLHLLSEKTQGKAIVVTDVGQHQMVAARYYQFKPDSVHITSGGLGTMGFALPAAIGAKLGRPDKQVLAIIGDGGFQMNIQELGVIDQEALPVKIIILNNQHLGMVRQWQELFFAQRYSFVELKNPDFTKIAEGYRIPALRVEKHEDLSHALDQLLAAEGSFLLEIIVEKQENIFPMIVSGSGVSEIRLS